ncbi:hypothetical protein RO3G_02140 [Rhizopus delemar RA 99-880]|uniref:Uncharacterized protein n=1 Tax=Rhizopus delemar (strain RA 99-880 / ATCC MYA-4621 / FGSC 9543 / NRRL 43880) TaxID=246409 RepID=I1BMK6_RHIO9|nr:hypothetical protein RO3G_02140 [Rhizopus delemar RA 99-880]|eukprot:EIE77436.1 hypothetical protein RO3G_02140 [Rhizopus delemar RA 99-880]
MQKQLEYEQEQVLSHTKSYNTPTIKTGLLSTPQRTETSSSAPSCKPKDLQSLDLNQQNYENKCCIMISNIPDIGLGFVILVDTSSYV